MKLEIQVELFKKWLDKNNIRLDSEDIEFVRDTISISTFSTYSFLIKFTDLISSVSYQEYVPYNQKINIFKQIIKTLKKVKNER